MANRRGSNSLLVPILIGISGGILLGGFLPAAGEAVAFVGELFINGLLMLVVPLVIASMIVGITGLGDVRRLGGIGGKTILYFATTTLLAVTLGLILVSLVQPGVATTEAARVALRGGEVIEAPYQIDGNTITLQNSQFKEAYDDSYQVILSDQNIRGVVETQAKPPTSSLNVAGWTDADNQPVTPKLQGTGVRADLSVAEKVKGKEQSSIAGMLRTIIIGLLPKNLFGAMVDNDVLPLIIFSLLFGAVLTTLGERGRTVIQFFEGVNEAIMLIVHLLMLVAPIGIGALIAGRLGEAGGFVGFWPELVRLGKYAVTVILGLLIHGSITLPLILAFIAKRNPLTYFANMGTALTTAFSTSSSSATLPMSIECTTEKNHISERTTSFVLPLGATINMDGTALYEAVAAVFIAQIYGLEIALPQMIVICLTATLASIGAAGIPEAGLVTMVIVLRAVGLPIEGISLILVIDWFLDRCRTTVNVWGDSIGAAVVEKLETEKGDQEPVAAVTSA